jgi:heme/copper-type cytochrome/quinol oxidase subunit 4
MSLVLKLFLTAVALVLVFAGGVDFGTTTVPGVAMLAYIWGFSPTLKQ